VPRVAALYRYPVKGLSPEPLTTVVLAAGETIPFDRAYAIENGPSPFDPGAPLTIKKAYFLMLMKNERLAELKTRFDERHHYLTIEKDGGLVAAGRLITPEGREAIEAYFNRAFADELRGPARILSAPGHSFSDTAKKVVSLINLATVREIEDMIGWPVNPLRFRANLYVEEMPAWAEFDLVGTKIAAGGVVFEALERIDRCAATNVDPDTGARDLAIPDSLREAYGHIDCGLYLRVTSPGTVSVGDDLELV
jgi:uncharacterized protein YcbX